MPRLILICLMVVTWVIPSGVVAQEARWKAEGWKTDFSRMAVETTEILSGGPPKDGIPPIDQPKFVPVSKEAGLSGREPVISFVVGGDARAYPLRIMMWHEIVNDTVGGKPVTVTFCPLCNAALVFDANVDGTALTFGTTGKLRKSDLIMYDRKTESWWQQFSGKAIAGTYTGQQLKFLPSRLESWSDFKSRYPKGKVLVPNNPRFREYGRNPYVNYDIAAAPFLYNGPMPRGIEPMARVIVIRRPSDDPLIITMQAVREAGSMEIGGFTLRWRAGQASALHQEDISKGRDVGTITVQTNEGNDVVHDVTFAFVAHAFHPGVTIAGK